MKYIALTIGPIYKTLKSVKSTKGIWSASYLFSYLMKRIIEGFVNRQQTRYIFLMPWVEYEDNSNIINWHASSAIGVGLLPDRFIFESVSENDFSILEEVIEHVFQEFSSNAEQSLIHHFNSFSQSDRIVERRHIYNLANASPSIRNEFEVIVKSYLQPYFLEIETVSKNPILEIQQYLDNIELQTKIIQKEDDSLLLYDFLENTYYNFLVRYAFRNNIDFPSAIEIATKQFQLENNSFTSISYNQTVRQILNNNDDGKSQLNFINELKEINNFPNTDFKQHHKYLTVIQADGDNIGAFIATIYDTYNNPNDAKEVFQKFSFNLMTFARCAVNLISTYGGTNIYAGGDDLLFFAPVTINRSIEIGFNDIVNFQATGVNINSLNILFHNQPNGKTVFWLIDVIDKLFNLFIAENPIFENVIEVVKSQHKLPSMSYGASVTYYKYPLNEAFEHGVRLLFHTAKKKGKNAVSFSVLKHSGQFFGSTFFKNRNSYLEFSNLLQNPNFAEKQLNSIMHKLDDQKYILQAIANKMSTSDLEEPDNHLFHFFDNNFDEGIHKLNKGFINATRHLVAEVFIENSSIAQTENGLNDIMDKIYAALKFIQFIKADDKNNEKYIFN